MQGKVTYNQEKILPVEIDLEMTQLLELTRKDFKWATINMVKDLKESMYLMSKLMGKINRKKRETIKGTK